MHIIALCRQKQKNWHIGVYFHPIYVIVLDVTSCPSSLPPPFPYLKACLCVTVCFALRCCASGLPECLVEPPHSANIGKFLCVSLRKVTYMYNVLTHCNPFQQQVFLICKEHCALHANNKPIFKKAALAAAPTSTIQ